MAFPVHWYLQEMCMTYGPKFPLKDSCRTHGISYRLPGSYKTHRCPEGPPAGNKQLPGPGVVKIGFIISVTI